MKKIKYIPVLLIGLLTVGGIVAALNKSIVSVNGAVNTNPTPASRQYTKVKTMPPEVQYLVLFVQLQDLKTRDVQNSLQGETSYFKKSFYEDRLGLQTSQMASIDTIIVDTFNLIQPVDQQAKQLIDNYRALNPGGKLKEPQATNSGQSEEGPRVRNSFEPLPPPPPQLAQLQDQKNQILLDARNRIKTELGNADFAAFESAVERHTSNVLVPANSRPSKPRRTPTSTN